MALDEQLRHTFDLVADRLRDELSRELTDAATAWAAKAQAERDAAADEAAARARAAAEADVEARLAAAVSEAEAHGRATAEHEGRSRTSTAQRRLADAVRALDAARSLTEILDTLATCTAHEADRAVVLVLRDGAFHEWRIDGAAASLVVPVEEGVAITETARRVLFATPDAAGRDSCAFPIALNGDVVAVVYGDGASTLDDAGRSHQPVAASEGDTGERSADRWSAALEVLARHAARCLEAVTAINTIRLLTAGARGRVSRGEDPIGVDAGISRGTDQAAARYARLLVSEIKLYHEAAVDAGRRERDLATRLGGEIARARALYDERVGAAAHTLPDFFHDELVRTLAGGDAGVLGAAAPRDARPTVPQTGDPAATGSMSTRFAS